jgi:hypothetical protein
MCGNACGSVEHLFFGLRILMLRRSGYLFVIVMLGLIRASAGQTIVPGTPGYCTQRPDKLYCLLPTLFDEANPNPFTPITSAFATQLTQLPLASPASGIIYTFDPRSGVPKRTGQETYGPVLTERGDTIGSHKLFIAFSYQKFTFSSLDGISLGAIPVVFDVCSITGQCAPIGTTNHLSLSVNQFAFFGTFGITSRIDLSVALPINRISESAASVTCGPCSGPFDFSNPAAPIQYVFQPAMASGIRTGLGDTVFRIKIQALSEPGYKLAIGSDFRAPTGDSLNFLGSGAVGVRPFVALSHGGKISPHVNLAYQWNGSSLLGSEIAGTDGKLANDFFYSVGVDASLFPKVTLAIDYLGDRVFNQYRLERISTNTAPSTSPANNVPDISVVQGSFNTAKGSIGLKYNPIGNLLLTGNVLVRFDHNGLRSNAVPLLGVSYSF